MSGHQDGGGCCGEIESREVGPVDLHLAHASLPPSDGGLAASQITFSTDCGGCGQCPALIEMCYMPSCLINITRMWGSQGDLALVPSARRALRDLMALSLIHVACPSTDALLILPITTNGVRI